MSGPTGMILNGFPFEAMGFGYEAVSRKVQTPWTDIAVAQTLNKQQWLGPTSDEVVIRGILFTAEFGGQGSLDGIIAMANAGVPAVLASGDAFAGSIAGIFTIQGVDQDRTLHTYNGVPRKNAYSISLKRADELGALTGAASIITPIINIFG